MKINIKNILFNNKGCSETTRAAPYIKNIMKSKNAFQMCRCAHSTLQHKYYDLFKYYSSSPLFSQVTFPSISEADTQWLAGIFQGDGSFFVTKKALSVRFDLTLASHEVQLLHKVKKMLKNGSIIKVKNKNAVRLMLHNRKAISTLIFFIHHQLKIVKFERYENFWNTFNQHSPEFLHESCKKSPKVNIQDCDKTYWTTGYFEADGHFAVSITYGQLSITISSKTKQVLDQIKQAFNGNICFDKNCKGYVYTASSKKDLQLWIDYFEKYPLKGPKNIQLVQFKRLMLFKERKYHLETGRKKTRFDNLIKNLQNSRKKSD